MSLSPYYLIRTLSKQHWLAAEQELVKNDRQIQWAGDGGHWSFYLVKEGDNLIKETRYKNRIVLREIVLEKNDF
jgi:hypothetical protein